MKKLLILCAIAFALQSCMGDCVSSEAELTTETYEFDDFTAIEIETMCEVELVQDTSAQQGRVEVTTHSDLQDMVFTTLENGVLKIKTDKCIDGELSLRVFFYGLNKIDVKGAVEMTTASQLFSESLGIDVSGAIDGDLDISVRKLDVDIKGAGDLNLKGMARGAAYDIKGACNVNALRLKSNKVNIGVKGAGDLDVWALDELNVSISGAGNVTYLGGPELTKTVSGIGDVEKYDAGSDGPA